MKALRWLATGLLSAIAVSLVGIGTYRLAVQHPVAPPLPVASGGEPQLQAATPGPSPSSARQPACAVPTLIGRLIRPTVSALARPDPTSEPIGSFTRINPQGAPQVFDLLGSTTDADGNTWYRALLPMRPNGTTGYLLASALQIRETTYRIDVDRRSLTISVWRGCRLVKRFWIGLGKESTPTPDGRFYVISLLRPPTPDTVYGTYAYGLSAFSDAITDWAGGGVIGIHGTDDPSSIGDTKSHGCIRMRNQDIDQLVPLIPLGTPVQISG